MEYKDNLSNPPNEEQEEHRRIPNKKLLLAFLLVFMVGIGTSYAVFSLNIAADFTVPPAPTISAAIVGSTACTIAGNGQSATCPSTTLSTSTSTATMTVTVQNKASGAVPIACGASSSNTAILTVSSTPGNPTSITGNGTASCQFTVQGVSGGTATITATISG